MTTKKFCMVFLVIVISLCFGYLIGQKDYPVAAQATTDSKTALFDILKKEGVLAVRRYEDDDGADRFVIQRRLDKPFYKDSSPGISEQLSVYDQHAKELFSRTYFHIVDFHLSYLTRSSTQLVVETNGGGTDDFLDIYNDKNGKFEEIIDSAETQMRGGYWTTPEYRTGMNSPYFTPSQIFVIGQIGGGDDNPSATVFRYKNGKYKSVGEIQMQQLGDFIETHISRK